WRNALAAGCGLAFAMTCRPMTAAGFALPFGVSFAIGWIRSLERSETFHLRDMARSTLAMGLPLLAGAALLLLQNRAITRDAFVTPYSQYTALYTPRHVYGFHNVERGEKQLGPKVVENYD